MNITKIKYNMIQYINKDAIIAEIERIKKEECPTDTYEGRCKLLWFEQFLSFINTLEVKEIPETTHTECKKIKKLCEIQRYDENGKAYSVMLPDTRLFMSKINDIIDAIDNIDSRLQIVEQKIGE